MINNSNMRNIILYQGHCIKDLFATFNLQHVYIKFNYYLGIFWGIYCFFLNVNHKDLITTYTNFHERLNTVVENTRTSSFKMMCRI